MVIKMLISGISASKEIKKHQQRAQMLLDSLKIRYETIDISEPGHEEEKELMRTVCKKRNNNPIAHPPQFFNEDQYCGDFEDLSLASDDDNVLSFLGLEEDVTIENGDVSSHEGMNDQNDSNTVLNGDKSPQIADDITDEILEELEDEGVTTVQERLTLNGKVIDIPADGLIELKGHKINIKDLIAAQTERQTSHSVVTRPSLSNEGNTDDTDNQNETNDENQMNVEEEAETKEKDGSEKGSEGEDEDIEEE